MDLWPSQNTILNPRSFKNFKLLSNSRSSKTNTFIAGNFQADPISNALNTRIQSLPSSPARRAGSHAARKKTMDRAGEINSARLHFSIFRQLYFAIIFIARKPLINRTSSPSSHPFHRPSHTLLYGVTNRSDCLVGVLFADDRARLHQKDSCSMVIRDRAIS